MVKNQTLFPFQGERFFDDEMLAGLGRGDGLAGMVLGITANRHDMNALVRQHPVQLLMAGDFASVPGAQLDGIKRARRTDRRHLGVGRRIDRGDMGATGPAVANDADVEFLESHACDRSEFGVGKMAPALPLDVKAKPWRTPESSAKARGARSSRWQPSASRRRNLTAVWLAFGVPARVELLSSIH